MSAVFALLATAAPAVAQSVTPVQHLSFGSFILMDNNAVYSLTVTAQGNTTYSPKMVPTVQAVNGIYQLQGFNPNADLSVAISPVSVQLSCTCSTAHMTLDNFDVQPAVPHTDSAGNATLNLGGRLTTDGSHTFAGVGQYSAQITILVNN